MTQSNIGDLTSKVYQLLKSEQKDDVAKILSSVATLLDLSQNLSLFNSKEQSQNNSNAKADVGNGSNRTGAKAFFDAKKPTTKGEELAVAAAFRIDNDMGETHTKDELKEIIKTQARRTFDDKNFVRDIDNAIRSAKLFMSADEKGKYILTDVGESFVSVLPDRAAAMKARKGAKRSKRPKKKSPVKSNKK